MREDGRRKTEDGIGEEYSPANSVSSVDGIGAGETRRQGDKETAGTSGSSVFRLPSSFVVGIAGGSASGKTTFTTALVGTLHSHYPDLRVETLGMDKYFYRGAHPGPRFVSPTSGEDLPDNNHPTSADNARLVADLDARIIAPDAPDVLILEGLMALHVEEIRQRLDVRIFVELEADSRALRRLLRDMNGGRGSTDPRWIATYYQECARPGHNTYVEPSRVHADLIVRGDADFARITPLFAGAIASQVDSRHATPSS